MTTENDTLIEFPCDFPIKVMGLRTDSFAQQVSEVVLRHMPDFNVASIEMRPSSKGNYLSLTCTVHTTSKPQLDDLYRELSSHPAVKMVL